MKTLFWNVDTQKDFMFENGKLAVPDAMQIVPNLRALTNYAAENGYTVMNTADWHVRGDAEISNKPDFATTYPMHCEKDTEGAKFILATTPKNPYVIDCREGTYDPGKLNTERNLVLYKNKFDAFTGNDLTGEVVGQLNPDKVVVYGVALNVCVDQAVMGNVQAGREVYAVTDAMKDLPGLPGELATEAVLDKWRANNVRFVTTKDVLENKLG